MNKIKLLYDVAKIISVKEALTGTLTVEVSKNDTPLFSLRSEFEKNLLTGQTKAKFNTELDYKDTTAKHESNTEFSVSSSSEYKRSHASRCSGMREKLTRLAFALSILNALKVEEQKDKAFVVSLNAADLTEDTKALLREKMSRAEACHHHAPGFLKEFYTADDLDFIADMNINANYEIEKILIVFVVSQNNAPNAPHDVTARVEISFGRTKGEPHES